MFPTPILLRWIKSQLAELQDEFARLKRTFNRIVVIGSIFGAAVLAVAGLTVWAAQKSASEAQSSKNLVNNLEEKTGAIVETLDKIRKNHVWQELHVGQDSEAVVAVIGQKTFVRFDGYTSENNYCQPFSLYVTRAHTDQLPVIKLAQRFEQIPPQVDDRDPLAVVADVIWKCRTDGQLVIHKGQKRGEIILRLKPPEIYEGSVSKP